MNDLSLVPIDEIFNELNKRCPTYIFIAIRPGAGPETVQVQMIGSQSMCLGMMEAVSSRIINSMAFERGIPKD